jgi:hypothetical protein
MDLVDQFYDSPLPVTTSPGGAIRTHHLIWHSLPSSSHDNALNSCNVNDDENEHSVDLEDLFYDSPLPVMSSTISLASLLIRINSYSSVNSHVS